MSSLQALHDYLLRASSCAIESGESAAPAVDDEPCSSGRVPAIANIPRPRAPSAVQHEPLVSAAVEPTLTPSNTTEVLVSEMRRLVADMISKSGLISEL
jgi:hypothetical protein